MPIENPPPGPSRPGRKRSAESRAAILTASFDLVGEAGYAGLTIEGIAARAGCGKQTIYRWWPSKADVLLDALATKAELHITVADHGSYARDLRAFLDDTYRLAGQQGTVDVLSALMAEAQIDTEFGERFRTAFLARRRDALRVVLDRAAERGDLPDRPGVTTVLDVVFGTLWYRILATREAGSAETLVDDLIATLTRAPGTGADGQDTGP